MKAFKWSVTSMPPRGDRHSNIVSITQVTHLLGRQTPLGLSIDLQLLNFLSSFSFAYSLDVNGAQSCECKVHNVISLQRSGLLFSMLRHCCPYERPLEPGYAPKCGRENDEGWERR